MYEDKKIENWNNYYIAEFIDAIYFWVSPLSYTGVLKLFAVNLVITHLLNFFIVGKSQTGTISAS